jgi:spore coat protein U-like protein
VWGDGTGGTTGFTGTAASKAPFALTIYGLIDAGQDADQDAYTDLVVATVTF